MELDISRVLPSLGLSPYPNAKIFGVNMKQYSKIDMILIGICGVIAIVSLLTVMNHRERPCPAGCGVKVKPSAAHFTPCTNCTDRVWDCVKHKPNGQGRHHRKECKGCLQWYHICDNSDLHAEKEERYRHRILGRREDGTFIYACKPEDTPSVPIPDK